MKEGFSVLGYRSLKSLIPGGPSFLWESCSQAGCWILHRKKKSQDVIGYCPRKVYLKILQCRLWGISTNALTHVHNHNELVNFQFDDNKNYNFNFVAVCLFLLKLLSVLVSIWNVLMANNSIPIERTSHYPELGLQLFALCLIIWFRNKWHLGRVIWSGSGCGTMKSKRQRAISSVVICTCLFYR